MSLIQMKSKLRKKPRKIGYDWSSNGWEKNSCIELREMFGNCDIVFWDNGDTDRAQFKKMYKTIRRGDTLIVARLRDLVTTDIQDLETSIVELLDNVCSLEASGIHLQVLHNFIDTTTDIGQQTLNLFQLCLHKTHCKQKEIFCLQTRFLHGSLPPKS